MDDGVLRGSNLHLSSSWRSLPRKNVCWQHVAEEVLLAAEEADEGRCSDGAKRGCADDCVCNRVLITSKGVTAGY